MSEMREACIHFDYRDSFCLTLINTKAKTGQNVKFTRFCTAPLSKANKVQTNSNSKSRLCTQ